MAYSEGFLLFGLLATGALFCTLPVRASTKFAGEKEIIELSGRSSFEKARATLLRPRQSQWTPKSPQLASSLKKLEVNDGDDGNDSVRSTSLNVTGGVLNISVSSFEDSAGEASNCIPAANSSNSGGNCNIRSAWFLCLEFFEIFTNDNLTCVISLPVDSQTSLEPGIYGELTFYGSNDAFTGKNLTLIVTGSEFSSSGDSVSDVSARGKLEASVAAPCENKGKKQQDLLHMYTQSEPTADPTSATETITCPYYSITNTDSASRNWESCYFRACGSKTISISGCDSCVYDQYINLYKDFRYVASNNDGCAQQGCSAMTYTIGSDDQDDTTCSFFELRQGCLLDSTCGGQFVVTITETDYSPTSTPTEQPTASFAAPGAESAAAIVGDDTGGFIYIEGNGTSLSVVLNNLIIQDFGRLDQLSVDFYFYLYYYGDDTADDDIHGSYAGALFVNDAGLTISNTLLRNNQALFGGAVTLRNTRLTMVSSTLIKNVGRFGGALYVESGSDAVRVFDCVFDANYATITGGAVMVEENNPGWKFTGVTFSGNSAAQYGGALYIRVSSSDWAFVNCSFADNVAVGEDLATGGAIAAESRNHYWQFDSVEFVGNKAAFGGALWSGLNNYWHLINCTFSNNIAPHSGGGIRVGVRGAQNWILEESTFSFNTASVNGGAIAIGGDDTDFFTYKNNTFIGNAASTNGGALAFTGQITQSAIIENTFVGNSGISIVVVYITSSMCAI
jgi:predicted outer membrane repeat protein